jgi:hypothetical protein
MENEIFRFVL